MTVSEVRDYWHSAPRRARRQTMFTAWLVLAIAVLVAASYLG